MKEDSLVDIWHSDSHQLDFPVIWVITVLVSSLIHLKIPIQKSIKRAQYAKFHEISGHVSRLATTSSYNAEI